MIQLRGLTKLFDLLTAVDALDLTIETGEAYTLLGPLGCGNSCVIKMLATVIPPTRGQAQVGGEDVRRNPASVRRIAGYMPDVMGAFDDMRLEECLRLFALGQGIESDAATRRIAELLALAEMEALAQEYVEALDREYRLRLGLVRAMLHAPRVLFLDKPAAGLDLAARRRFFEVVQRLRSANPQQPVTLLISSNLLSDALHCCSRIGVMLNARLIAEGSSEEIALKLSPHCIFEIELAEEAGAAAAWLRTQPNVRHADAHGGYLIFTLLGRELPDPVIQRLGEQGFSIRHWREHEIDFGSLVTPAQ